MNLFQLGSFVLASGRTSSLKIDCDALTDEDWATAAYLASQIYRFSEVRGVPTGGLKFATACQRYLTPGQPLLVVDDVWTTGDSMREFNMTLQGYNRINGLVLFSRGPLDLWVKSLFTLNLDV